MFLLLWKLETKITLGLAVNVFLCLFSRAATLFSGPWWRLPRMVSLSGIFFAVEHHANVDLGKGLLASRCSAASLPTITLISPVGLFVVVRVREVSEDMVS